MLIMNACMASTMVIGVNHVNLSTDVGKTAANTIPRVSYPVSNQHAQGPPLPKQNQEHDLSPFAGGAIRMGLGGGRKNVLRVLQRFISV